MPFIRRTPIVEDDVAFVTINSTHEEITEAVTIAITRYLSLIKNRSTTFGKLILLKRDSSIQYTERELDIVSNPQSTRSFVEGISSFMTIELGSRVRGQLKQKVISDLLHDSIQTLALFTKGDIDEVAIVKVDNTICSTVVSKKTQKKVIFRVTPTTVIFETGNAPQMQEVTDAIRDGGIL